MLLNEEQFRRCVAFLTIEKPDEDNPGQRTRVPVGSVFFVAVPLEPPLAEYAAMYAVTARHIIVNSRPRGPLYLRVNKRAGGSQEFPVPHDRWATHDSTDVAVTRLPFGPGAADFVHIRVDQFVREDDRIGQLFKAGDDVIFAGLYSKHPGTGENEPILRFGNISLMPREKVWVRLEEHGALQPIDAVLVEARSWGGQSGSPAFVDRSRYGGPGPYLLGLVHGHGEISEGVEIQGEERGRVAMNAGIAIVVPAQRIMDTLMRGDVAAERAADAEALSRRIAAGSSEPPPAAG